MQKDLVDNHEADKLQLRLLENSDEVNVFNNRLNMKADHFSMFLYDILLLNRHKGDESFKNKIKKISRVANRHRLEIYVLLEAKKKEVFKGLSPEIIQKFLQLKAYESHVGDQCQVCLEEVEIGRLMKQLDC